MKSVPGTLQEGGVAFASTRWNLVLVAAQSQSPEAMRGALADFCQLYWPPIYTFLRRRGCPPDDAQDLTQGFFAHLLQKNSLRRADPQQGRLRTFLLGALQHFLANEADRARTLKRGGGWKVVSMDEHLAEAEAALVAANGVGDTRFYDQTWAATLVSRAWERLQEALTTEGQARWLEELKPFLVGGTVAPPRPDQVAVRLCVPVDTVRSALRRLRMRYRECLQEEVASTVSDPTQIEEESKYLFQLLLD